MTPPKHHAELKTKFKDVEMSQWALKKKSTDKSGQWFQNRYKQSHKWNKEINLRPRYKSWWLIRKASSLVKIWAKIGVLGGKMENWTELKTSRKLHQLARSSRRRNIRDIRQDWGNTLFNIN